MENLGFVRCLPRNKLGPLNPIHHPRGFVMALVDIVSWIDPLGRTLQFGMRVMLIPST